MAKWLEQRYLMYYHSFLQIKDQKTDELQPRSRIDILQSRLMNYKPESNKNCNESFKILRTRIEPEFNKNRN